MKCPNCLYTMECISEIHKVPGQPGRERMDLHCVRPIPLKNSDRIGRACARCHMGVITEDPKPCVCLEYNLSFNHNGEVYYLSSFDNLVDPYNQHRAYGTRTSLSVSGQEIAVLPYFVPLSTGDDMHEEAWKLFHRLRNLVIFS